MLWRDKRENKMGGLNDEGRREQSRGNMGNNKKVF